MTTTLELFRSGMDTARIASKLGMTEAEVETNIHRLRSAEKGDNAQQEHEELVLSRKEMQREYKRRYHQRKKQARKSKTKMIPYAGFDGRQEWSTL